VKASLFTETEEQKKKVKEVKEAKEKVQFYTNEVKRLEEAYANAISQVDKQQIARDKESAEVYAEKWTLRAEMLSRWNSEFHRRRESSPTLLNEKQGNYWIKIIENTNWDAEEYRQFYNHSGHEFLPKLIDYEIFESYMELKMEYIEGDSPQLVHHGAILRYLSYKIIPTLYEWSRLRKIEAKHSFDLIKRDKIYMHDDLKFNNFLITKNDKLYLMDINAFFWHDFDNDHPRIEHRTEKEDSGWHAWHSHPDYHFPRGKWHSHPDYLFLSNPPTGYCLK